MLKIEKYLSVFTNKAEVQIRDIEKGLRSLNAFEKYSGNK
jgi:hypothetical protein